MASFELCTGSPFLEDYTSVQPPVLALIFSFDRTDPHRYNEEPCAFTSSIFSLLFALQPNNFVVGPNAVNNPPPPIIEV